MKYGLRSDTLQQAAKTVGEVFGLRFDIHDSSYRGGDYFRVDVPEGTIYIQSNYDVLEQGPFEESWPSNQFLLYFDGLDDENWLQYTKRIASLEASNVVLFLK